jgi:hypothetical protein
LQPVLGDKRLNESTNEDIQGVSEAMVPLDSPDHALARDIRHEWLAMSEPGGSPKAPGESIEAAGVVLAESRRRRDSRA